MNLFKSKLVHGFLVGSFCLIGCHEDTKENQEILIEKEDLTKLKGDKGKYEFTRDGKSTVDYSGQTTRLKQSNEISAALKQKTTTLEKLNEMFGDGTGFTQASLNGSKNIRSKTANSVGVFQNGNNDEAEAIKQIFDDYLYQQVNEVFPKWDTKATLGTAGFIQVGDQKRYVNDKGLEYDQAFMKSLIGALVVDQVANHYLNRLDDNYDGTNNYREANTQGTLVEGEQYTTMEHHWDEAYGYVFGNPSEDALLYKYIQKVDEDEDFKGIFDKIRNAFGEGRYAITQKDYDTRDAQIKIIREEIAKVVAIRAIYYLKAGKTKLSEPKTAFHDLSEGYGFIHSLRFVTNDGKTAIFSKEEVDTWISRLKSGGAGFWNIPATTLESIIQQIDDKFASFAADKI